ncbi:MAG: tRNA (adenosine(37)-N6)-threonylcarbamoyltransferase complex ATPase subunit type 1 TsaE [Neomegalonema sp.]|nr:tRNA (adenosine(37)-N6)-threonylcarbamoyltransferase complex ATPase subunit type 1 TsaE [Neomegalonema sp.]
MTPTPPLTQTLMLGHEQDSRAVGQAIASALRGGDVLLLEGSLGAGKSFLARAIIQSLIGEDEPVPSPTYTLVQCYDAPDFEIRHADLYRLGDPEEAEELGLFDDLANAVLLIEWPERLGDATPGRALTLSLNGGAEPEARILALNAVGEGWTALLDAAAMAAPAAKEGRS